VKVLVIHSELGVLRGGGENFTRNLFSAFASRGHEVKAAFLADNKRNYPIPLPSNIEPIPIPGWWSRNAGQRAFSSIRHHLPCKDRFRVGWDRLQEAVSWRIIKWHDRRFQRRVERDFAHKWDEFDAVYVHASPLLASKIARRRPTILRLPGPTTADMAPILRAVHAVCANGDVLKLIREFLGDHAVELPIGVDSARFRPEGPSIRSDLNWNEADRVIGYVGRLTHLKGVDLLASAFHEISHIVPYVKLLMVGSGAEEKFIRSVLGKHIARGVVHIEPDVDHEQLANWYRTMDLFVMPSRYENFSNATLEAMACGIPVLASDIGGNRISCGNGRGWLFEPGSISSLSLSIQHTLQSRAEMDARGHSAANYARDCCAWTNSAQALERVFVSRLGVPA